MGRTVYDRMIQSATSAKTSKCFVRSDEYTVNLSSGIPHPSSASGGIGRVQRVPQGGRRVLRASIETASRVAIHGLGGDGAVRGPEFR